MDDPLVSVVTPFRDAAATLGATVASLRAQTFPRWEAILVDDGSTDGSAALVEAVAAEDGRLRLVRAPSWQGAAEARNLGIDAARGRYVAFLDADDLWLPEKLAFQVPRLEAGAAIVFSSYRRVDPAGRELKVVRARPRVRYQDALGGNPIGCLTAVWDCRRFPDARMPLLPMREDYAFWLSLLRRGAEAEGLPEVLAEYRVSPASRSGRKLRAARATWGVLRREPGLTLPRAAAGFALYALRAAARRM